MGTLEHGRFYRFPDGTVAQAVPVSDGWWQLTDVADVQGRSAAPERWHTWGVAPSGALHEGPVSSTIDKGTHAGAPLALHVSDLVEVVPSGMDYPVADAGAWTPAALLRDSQDDARQPAGFDDGFPGYDGGEPPAFDESAWAWASPLPARAQEVDRSKLAIKDNNLGAAGPCAICGGVADPPVGLALFMANSYDPVCDRCGATHAPVLAAMVNLYHAIKAEEQ